MSLSSPPAPPVPSPGPRATAWSLPRLWSLVLLLASAAALMGALYGEFALGIAPCILCLYQRLPWVGLAVLAGFAFQPTRTPVWRRRAMLAAALVLWGAGGLAFFHLGVEQHWWAGTESCAPQAPATGPSSLQDLQAALALEDEVRRPACDQPAWALFGITFAGFNLLANLFLAAGTTAVLLTRRFWRPAS